MATAATETPQSGQRTLARTVAGNTFANVTRLAITSLVSVFLPAYLTHHLPVKTYGAWVLILQLSAYVGYLDFGVQTAVSKYIAEHQAKRDAAGSAACASGGLAIMLVASVLGALLTLILVWRVPVIFRTMPASYYHDVRLSVLFVGVSLSVTLATSVFVAIFLGLQRYRVPMVTTIVSRLAFGLVICAAAAAHSSLAVMGAAAASVNVLNALLQVGVWRKSASHIRVSLRLIDMRLIKRMLQYCAVLTVWSVCAMFISGLDLTIVGHYSFGETAYYAIANAPTAFLITVVAALMGPLLPAASAQSVGRSPAQMGTFLLQATRYSSIVLLLTGLPFLVVGFLILRAWVGPAYALHSTPFLRILILANIIRSSCAPYSTMVIATARQRVATASPVTEGIVNVVSSIWLVQHLGALGVAFGTLCGAIVGVAIHFAVSMRFTQSSIAISRTELFLTGMLRPAVITIPSLLFLWHGVPTAMSSAALGTCCACIAATLFLAWFVAMNRDERQLVARVASQRLGFSFKANPQPGPDKLMATGIAGKAGE
jgi:O-antigen/teichoic acid export membrane protein